MQDRCQSIDDKGPAISLLIAAYMTAYFCLRLI